MLYCACVPSISINIFLLSCIVAFFIFNVFCPYNNFIPVDVTLSIPSGNSIFITGFLNNLYFPLSVLNVAVKLTLFSVNVLHFVLSTDKSTCVSGSFNSTNFLLE